jgi:hypothetical protein
VGEGFEAVLFFKGSEADSTSWIFGERTSDFGSATVGDSELLGLENERAPRFSREGSSGGTVAFGFEFEFELELETKESLISARGVCLE